MSSKIRQRGGRRERNEGFHSAHDLNYHFTIRIREKISKIISGSLWTGNREFVDIFKNEQKCLIHTDIAQNRQWML